ncbi:hypothetical protein EVA_01125 [gut metagenome]|uniref:Uncharacterized protein n=1 Tax=gut metagenome TaxID=749906 RepID=J9GRG8_9ZZZZ
MPSKRPVSPLQLSILRFLLCCRLFFYSFFKGMLPISIHTASLFFFCICREDIFKRIKE